MLALLGGTGPSLLLVVPLLVCLWASFGMVTLFVLVFGFLGIPLFPLNVLIRLVSGI